MRSQEGSTRGRRNVPRLRRRVVGGLVAASVVAAVAGVACEFGGTDEVTRINGDSGGGSLGPASADASLQGLCARAGGPDNVRAIIVDAVGRIAADCRIGAYVTGLNDTQKAHFTDCLTLYTQEMMTCPGVTYAGSNDSAGTACRDLKTAHQNMGLTATDESAFQDDLAGALRDTGKLIPTDIGNVVTHLAGERNVFDGNKQYSPKCTCTPADSTCGTPPPPPNDGGTRDTGPPPQDSGSTPDTGSDGAAD